jgi:hypothetical protein
MENGEEKKQSGEVFTFFQLRSRAYGKSRNSFPSAELCGKSSLTSKRKKSL